ALRLPLLPTAGVRDAVRLRGLRADSHVRWHLSVAQERALDRQVALSARALESRGARRRPSRGWAPPEEARLRSEERRVGKEWRSRWAPYGENKEEEVERC